ncbi:transglycosylase family protein [Streptomyces sp. NPDC047022]|uniref:LysM peptidoglycan-binding domain-containing protein n=1 Tax=Streptomyces sp. NPDC047022 TaxID=3155737 RepID=UPI0033F78211
MLSGNGRHRRPRQAPAILVAAGVTGSAIAIPLLGATGASAASGSTWDQVAQCESGGSWSADTGDGHYGGLRLTLQDWDKYGGLDYAASPDQASRSQQIAVAEKILADRGVSAWPGCGRSSGLNEDSGSADVVTGLANDLSGGSRSGHGADSGSGMDSGMDSGIDSGLSDSSGSSGSSGASGSPNSSDSSASATPAPSSPASPSGSSSPDGTPDGAQAGSGTGGSTAPATKHDESDKSGRDDSSSEAGGDKTPGAGRHRGGSAEDGAEGGRTGDLSGRHASRDSGAARDTADDAYTVRPGDTLSAIADSLDLKGGWAELYEANKRTVGADPDLIFPGQSLALDAEPTPGHS